MRKLQHPRRNPAVHGRQCLQAAALALELDADGVTVGDETAFLGGFLPEPEPTAGGMIRILLSLSRCRRTGVAETLRLVAGMTPAEARRELERIRRLAGRLARLEENGRDGAGGASSAWGAGLLPAEARWDAVHDGHPATRRATWALGLVRYAVAMPDGHAARITALLASMARDSGSSGRTFTRILRLWLDRRPLVFIDGSDTVSMKLVHDLWLADPDIAVVSGGRSLHGRNPFRPLDVPFVEDPRGHLRALAGVDGTPALLERRLGGVTLTCPTGTLRFGRLRFDGEPDSVRPSSRGRLAAVPAWMRTMAEIGFLERHAELLTTETKPREDGPGGDDFRTLLARHRLLRLYRRLLDAPVAEGARGEIPQAALDEIRAVRADYLRGRRMLLGVVNRSLSALSLRLRATLHAELAQGRAADGPADWDALAERLEAERKEGRWEEAS